jgi:predicted phosphoribosyltransferase
VTGRLSGFLVPEWMTGGPFFRDRSDAGRQLARELSRALPKDHPVVVGLARGGVPVAAEVAQELQAPLDALAVRKIGHPRQPEYGLGAVAPGGTVFLRATDGLTASETTAAVERALAAVGELDLRLHATRPALQLTGRIALLVDDGLATGATMVAALRWARRRGATQTIAAVPVAARESAELIRAEADAFACPHEVSDFGAVGLWYEEFTQVSDAEVLRLLDESAARLAGHSPPRSS